MTSLFNFAKWQLAHSFDKRATEVDTEVERNLSCHKMLLWCHLLDHLHARRRAADLFNTFAVQCLYYTVHKTCWLRKFTIVCKINVAITEVSVNGVWVKRIVRRVPKYGFSLQEQLRPNDKVVSQDILRLFEWFPYSISLKICKIWLYDRTWKIWLYNVCYRVRRGAIFVLNFVS